MEVSFDEVLDGTKGGRVRKADWSVLEKFVEQSINGGGGRAGAGAGAVKEKSVLKSKSSLNSITAVTAVISGYLNPNKGKSGSGEGRVGKDFEGECIECLLGFSPPRKETTGAVIRISADSVVSSN